MQAFLNELSIPHLSTPQEVRLLFSDLFTVYKQVRNYGIKEIKVKATFLEHEFADTYTFQSWIGDRETDADLRTLLIGVFTTAPFIEDISVKYEEDKNKIIETFFEEERCYGLGLASNLMFDTVSFSFNIKQEWANEEYEITANLIQEIEDGSFVEMSDTGLAKNISTLAHGTAHLDFLKLKVHQSLPNGTLLWEKRKELFPNLDFCAKVQSQISELQSGNPEFGQILTRLFDLQNFAVNWDGSPIKPADFVSRVTPESATRLKKFSDELTIVCPDGNSRLFNWHSRYTPGAGRIHFFPISEGKLIYVGSIANQNVIK